MARSLEEHLFRHESARMTAALTRLLGVHHLALVEDVVQDAFCRALEVWRVRGVPDSPGAWLMTTARHRALDVVRREQTARTFAPEVARLLGEEWPGASSAHDAFAAETIRDGQLRMMFSCCHPRLPEEVQVALVLNVLCGFGAPEIASAFLTSRAAMEKRLARGKRALASAQHLFDLADAEFAARLGGVQRALYLLFTEGHHAVSPEATVRVELCREAIRLVDLLREHAPADTPATRALAALMYLHAARLPARTDAAGDFTALRDQDRSRWDRALLGAGLALLERSAAGTALSSYHVEAAIAATHARARTYGETDWATIVALYDHLMAIAPSPVVALGRAIATAERDGAGAGLAALRAIDDPARLARYPFYEAALGEAYLRLGDTAHARAHHETAHRLARTRAERRFLTRRLAATHPVEGRSAERGA